MKKMCNVVAIVIVYALTNQRIAAMESDKKEHKKSKTSWADAQDSPASKQQSRTLLRHPQHHSSAFKSAQPAWPTKPKQFSNQPPKDAMVASVSYEQEQDQTKLLSSINRNLQTIRGTSNSQQEQLTSTHTLLSKMLHMQQQQFSIHKQMIATQRITNDLLRHLVQCKQMQLQDQAQAVQYYMQQQNQAYNQEPQTYQNAEQQTDQQTLAPQPATFSISPINAASQQSATFSISPLNTALASQPENAVLAKEKSSENT